MPRASDYLVGGPTGRGIRGAMQLFQPYLRLFAKGEANAILRNALATAAWYWITSYLPLRFTPYARGKLGYRGRNRTPLVASGETRDTALREAYPEARVANAGEKLRVTIRIPGPAYVNTNKKVNEILRRVTPEEIDRMARVFERAVKDQMEQAEVSEITRGKRAGQLRARLAKARRVAAGRAKATREGES